MPIYCDGCRSKFNREAQLLQHLQKSKSPLCTAAWNAWKAKMRPVRGRVRSVSQSNTRPAIQQPPNQPLDELEPMNFEGDFFGQRNDYTSDEFPFPDDFNLQDLQQDLPQIDEQSDHSDSSDSDADDVSDSDTPPQDLQGHRPTQRLSVSVPAAGSEEMQVERDEEAIPATQATPPNAPGGISIESHQALRSAPKYITEFPHPMAGAPLFRPHGTLGGYSQYAYALGGNDSPANLWAPFAGKMEWEVARWFKLRGPGATAFNELLAIDGNHVELNKIIDSLPSKRPAFTRAELLVGGQPNYFYSRDVIECIKALYGDPQHAQYLVFKPERHYADPDKTQRLYHDMHTGDSALSVNILHEDVAIPRIKILHPEC
ncbi:hypothetical protein BJ912DRAFT_923181 [Pholiota molesta]|nr:hypothetical protein BJ912DRAFT_923181 [Pholiota molesta]